MVAVVAGTIQEIQPASRQLIPLCAIFLRTCQIPTTHLYNRIQQYGRDDTVNSKSPGIIILLLGGEEHVGMQSGHTSRPFGLTEHSGDIESALK